jgi:amino acid adenylation domain-containing protein
MQMSFLIQSPLEWFASRTPDHPALAMGGEEMSYRELEMASNQLAHALLESGCRNHDRVGIYMHKSLDLGVAIYGTLKAGAVFVPLDPFLPNERLKFILQDCGIEHLIVSDVLARNLDNLQLPKMPCLYGAEPRPAISSVAWSKIRSLQTDPPRLTLIDQDLAYIMYTSGSTGEPKGMMHTHHGSISYANWGAQHVGLTSTDRVASHAPLHFDLSIFDFFSTARAGATVVLVPEPVTKFPASWTQYIDSEKISVVFTVPHTLIEMAQKGASEKRDLTSLRWIMFGGEPMPPKYLRELMTLLPGCRFTNVYGPAEAPSCTCFDINGALMDVDQSIPIGTVSANSTDLILRDDDSECEFDEDGELCIRSSTLMKGYWNRPDLNALAFFKKTSFGFFPDIYYRTGDVVRRSGDGLLHFLGRKDRMVKTRGYRVELDEVEAALNSHPDVAEVAAYTVTDQYDGKRIVASITLEKSGTVGTSEVLQHAASKIPRYALPTSLDIIAEFPRTSSGKIDRKALAKRPR